VIPRNADVNPNKDIEWEIVFTRVLNVLYLQGFVFPRTADVNPNKDIEWEIVFTCVETFLWRSIHHPKLRVYLFSVLLFKAYFEAFEVPTID
jgi:hypothetical protein